MIVENDEPKEALAQLADLGDLINFKGVYSTQHTQLREFILQGIDLDGWQPQHNTYKNLISTSSLRAS